MAAPSPALSTASSDVGSAATTTLPSHRTDTPSKTLRGLNKPKCIQCGNVARSRCPYQSCKSCCSKAQNPCHIHVLKANATFPDKTTTSSTPLFDQQSTEVSPAASSLRVASLRQLSNNFSQFNNLHASRSRKPLTRKEAASINEWRFSKLKEYRDRNIEVENVAFDRYMQNITLLEEVFSVNSKVSTEDGSQSSNLDNTSAEDHTDKATAGKKLKLMLNPTRNENFRKRVQQIIDGGLKRFQKREFNDNDNDQNSENELNKGLKRFQKREFNDNDNDQNSENELNKQHEETKKSWAERTSAVSDLTDKLNKARNEEDLASCLEMKAQLYNHKSQTETMVMEVSHEGAAKNDFSPIKELDYLSQKLFRTVEIDQEDLNRIGENFSSLQKLANL